MNEIKIKFAQIDNLFIAYSAAVEDSFLEVKTFKNLLDKLPNLNNRPLLIFGSSYVEAKYIGFALMEQGVALPEELLFGVIPNDLDDDSKRHLIDSHIKYIKGESDIANETSISLIHWNNSLKIPLFGEFEQIAAILENFKYNKIEEYIDDEIDIEDAEYHKAANSCNEYSIYLWPSFEINSRLNHICLSLKLGKWGYTCELKGHGKYQHFKLSDSYKKSYYTLAINELNTLISDQENLTIRKIVSNSRSASHEKAIEEFSTIVFNLRSYLPPAQPREKAAVGFRSSSENVTLEPAFKFAVVTEDKSGKLILKILSKVKNKKQKYRINSEPELFSANNEGCIELPPSIKLLDGDSYAVTWTLNEVDESINIFISVD